MSNAHLTVKALVLREAVYKDSGKILTVLTESDGKLTVSARGAKRKGSMTAAVSQQLTYSELTLSDSRGRWYLNEGCTIEQFQGLRNDIAKLALGTYFAEILESVSDEDSQSADLLRLALNSLYALSEDLKPRFQIKAAFELRIMSVSGYEPLLEKCASCGKRSLEKPFLDITNGILLCESCTKRTDKGIAALCGASLDAFRYIINADINRVFSFSIKGEAAKRLDAAAEAYLEAQLEKRFKSLEFYRKLE